MVANMTFSLCYKGEQIYLYRFDVETESLGLIGIFEYYIEREQAAVFYGSGAFNQVGKIP